MAARLVLAATLTLFSASAVAPSAFAEAASVEEIFSPEGETQRVMAVEAAIARAQAAHGLVSRRAAQEITQTASLAYAPMNEIEAARARLGHRMEALLHVWRSRLSEEAQGALHYGTTTVDVYDTALSLQISSATDALIARNDAIIAALADLAAEHRGTPMAGRTLGQHALAMTFGKKVAVWVGEMERHQQRLCQMKQRIDRSVILKGPVGSYAGLGPDARKVEIAFARELGKPAPYEDDWHGARDVYAETALTISLLSRSLARMGQEIFLLQSTDVAEVREALGEGRVSSSSMPQKVNPVLSEALMHHGRTLPRAAEVMLDDVVNFYERDNTSRPNALMGELLVEADAMLVTAAALFASLHVDADAMRANLDRSGPMMRAQALVQALTPAIGREAAAAEVKAAALSAREDGAAFIDALAARPAIAGAMSREALADVLEPLADLEGAMDQVDAVLEASGRLRDRSCPAR